MLLRRDGDRRLLCAVYGVSGDEVDNVVRRIEFNEPMVVSTLSGHRRVAPYDMAGGSPGALGRNRVERADGKTVELAGCDSTEVQPGDNLVIETPGGGGYGTP